MKLCSEPSELVPLDRQVVFNAISDPTTYPEWLIGAKEIREVERTWPARGARFFHRVGLIGPLTVADSTSVVDIDPPSRLTLEVRARPIGRGRATFRLSETTSDEHPGVACTLIELEEEPLGHLRWAQPVLTPLTAARNKRSLQRLRDLLVG